MGQVRPGPAHPVPVEGVAGDGLLVGLVMLLLQPRRLLRMGRLERTWDYLVLLLLLKVVEVWGNRWRREVMLISPLSGLWHRLGRRRVLHAARRV